MTIQEQIDALRESLTVLDDPHHFAAIARNMSESADTMTAMLAVVEAAEPFRHIWTDDNSAKELDEALSNLKGEE